MDAGTLRNTASASITVGGVAATNSGFVDVTGTRTPSLTIDKQQAAGAPASFNAPGVGLTYIYIVRNTGNVTFNAPTVADDRVAVTCPAGTIAPNTSVTCTSAVYTTTQADVNAGGVTNTATATAAPVGGGAAVTSPSDSVTVPSIRNPAMTVAKSAPNLPAAQFVVGNTVTYSYTVTNTGNVGLAQQVTITDDKIGAPFNCGAPGLVPGQSLTCTATYAFTLADVAAGFVTNRAFGTSGTTTSNTDTVTVPQSGTPDIAVAKTATTASFTTLGQTIDYSFTITNSGQTTITQAGQPVTLNDPKLTTNNCAAQQPVQLIAGASFTCTGSYTGVTQAEMDAGQVVNTATASFVFNGGGGPVTVTSPTSTATVPSAAAPAVTVAKSAVPAQFTSVGQTITYTFTITNTGLQTLATATVTDPLIPSLSCTRTNIAPAGTANCTGTYAVTQADMDAGVVNNTATVDALTPANVPATNAGSTTVPVAPGSATKSMTLAKTANPSPFAAVGSTVAYTFAVTNTGTQTLTGITVTDPLIPSFTCNIATLAPGAVNNTCTANYTVTQADVNAGSRANTATATAPGAANATSTITTPGPARAPSLTLAKAGPASFTAAGQNVVYTFTVRNTGNVTLTGVTVTDPLVPAFTCTIPTLAPGASSSTCQATYVATQADVDAGQIVNTGSVSATPPGGGPVTATGADTTPGPTRAPALTMTKAGPASFTGPGQTISYAFTVRNTGNVTLTGITVTDPLIPSFTCTIPTLSPGATDTSCSTTYLTTQADVNAGSIVNSAAASATAPGGGSASTTATDTTPGPARTPAISMAKSAVAPVPVITMPGQTVSIPVCRDEQRQHHADSARGHQRQQDRFGVLPGAAARRPCARRDADLHRELCGDAGRYRRRVHRQYGDGQRDPDHRRSADAGDGDIHGQRDGADVAGAVARPCQGGDHGHAVGLCGSGRCAELYVHRQQHRQHDDHRAGQRQRPADPAAVHLCGGAARGGRRRKLHGDLHGDAGRHRCRIGGEHCARLHRTGRCADAAIQPVKCYRLCAAEPGAERCQVDHADGGDRLHAGEHDHLQLSGDEQRQRFDPRAGHRRG